MKTRNWSRFLFRLWVVGSTLWVGIVLALAAGEGLFGSTIQYQARNAWTIDGQRIPPRSTHEITGIEAGFRGCRVGSDYPHREAVTAEWASRIAAGATATPVPTATIDWDSIVSQPDETPGPWEHDSEPPVLTPQGGNVSQRNLVNDEVQKEVRQLRCDVYTTDHAALEALAEDLERKRRDAILVAFLPPLLVLTLSSAVRWALRGLVEG